MTFNPHIENLSQKRLFNDFTFGLKKYYREEICRRYYKHIDNLKFKKSIDKLKNICYNTIRK